MADVDEAARPRVAPMSPGSDDILHELATLITSALNLDVSADQIDPDAPLYREGLGLDSIDILEIAVVVAKRYELQLKADSQENHQIFRSLRSLADYVERNAPAPHRRPK
jgi:acyl carrier protein